MFLIVGLGNYGKEYEHTRHNVGFDIVELLAKKHNIDISKNKFKGIYGDGRIGNEKVLILKPMTYMNLSGESVKQVCDFYKIPSENIIVIYDDISLDVGRLRIREKGSAGGHNGIKNIILNTGTDIFPRIKVGVGQPLREKLTDHVLGKFTTEQREKLEKVFDGAIKSVEEIIENNISDAMNKFNGFKVE